MKSGIIARLANGLSRQVVVAVFAVTAPAIGAPAVEAQSARDIPVLKVQPDVNGVDVAMGTFVPRSPFTLASPGASRLDAPILFNGRRSSFDLTVYVSDQTFTSYGDDRDRRNVTVHLGSAAKFSSATDWVPVFSAERSMAHH